MSDRVVVTGGRNYADSALVYATLDSLRPTAIAQGDAAGADGLARVWAFERGIPCSGFKADWTRGKVAGPERNRRMLDEFKPDLVIAFPGGRGTANCIKEARKRNIPVRIITPTRGPDHAE
jgi:hypothetical protein